MKNSHGKYACRQFKRDLIAGEPNRIEILTEFKHSALFLQLVICTCIFHIFLKRLSSSGWVSIEGLSIAIQIEDAQLSPKSLEFRAFELFILFQFLIMLTAIEYMRSYLSDNLVPSTFIAKGNGLMGVVSNYCE